MTTVRDDEIADMIGKMLDRQEEDKSLCPSDVARALAADESTWRALMPRIRSVAAELADRRVIRVTRRGRDVDPRNPGGPIRLSKPGAGYKVYYPGLGFPAGSQMADPKADSFSYDQLIASGEGRLFDPESGRLPLPPMLMFDRICRIDDNGGAYGLGSIHAELDIRPDLWFFGCHFVGDPVMPGCLGLDAMWQLVGFYLTWLRLPGRGRALGAGEVKFTGEVGPDAKLVTYRIDIKRIIRRKLVMAMGDGRMLVDGREIYAANDLRVGLFKKEQAAQDLALKELEIADGSAGEEAATGESA